MPITREISWQQRFTLPVSSSRVLVRRERPGASIMNARRSSALISLLILGTPLWVFSQLKVPAAPISPLPGQARTGHPQQPQQEPCWKQVGISPAIMEEQRAIQRESRAQVEAVCSDPSLSEQQKREKIQEIRKSEQERLTGLIPAQQREELKQCQLARANSHPAPAPHRPAAVHTGPCGD